MSSPVPDRFPPTPALCVDRELLDANIDSVLQIAGDPALLWPHVKTYKSSRLVMRLQSRGIRTFKCATIAEAAMLGRCGAREALLAYPLTGPSVDGLVSLASRHRATRFSCLVEDAERLSEIETAATAAHVPIGVFIDVDPGQGRTGVSSLDAIVELASRAAASDRVALRGLHLYDGHNHQHDLEERIRAVHRCLRFIDRLRDALGAERAGTIIAGGTPTFPIYARAGLCLSPGTAFLFDSGYADAFPDLPFVPAAWVTGRVVSTPREGVITLDVGTKAIATDPKGSRGRFVDLEVAEVLIHNEEHWVVSLDGSTPVCGATVRIIPTHICPTVNLYNELYLVDREGLPVERWSIDARDRVVD